jgi:hypothetical protein
MTAQAAFQSWFATVAITAAVLLFVAFVGALLVAVVSWSGKKDERQ